MTTFTTSPRGYEPLRTQFDDDCDALFPLYGPEDLLRLVANSRGVFVVDETELLGLELVLTVGDALCFPYENVDSLVNDISTALRNAR